VPGVLGTVQWLLMSVHIFWDNMFFCTHPIVVRRASCGVRARARGVCVCVVCLCVCLTRLIRRRVMCANRQALIDLPESPWFNNDATNQHQKNWRAMSDVTGLVAAYMAWAKDRQAVSALKGGSSSTALESAEAKRKESFYSMLKLMADVATYEPTPPPTYLHTHARRNRSCICACGHLATWPAIRCGTRGLRWRKSVASPQQRGVGPLTCATWASV